MPTSSGNRSPRPGTWVVLLLLFLGVAAAALAWAYWRNVAQRTWSPAATAPAGEAAGAARWDPKAARAELEEVRRRFDQTGGAGDLASVLGDARRLAERYPRYAEARTLLAQVLLFDRQVEAAYDQLKLSLQIDKQQPDVQLAAGNVAEQLGRIDEAARYYSDAADLAPREPRYRIFLANIYLKKKETERARAALLEALAVDSSRHEAYALLSAVYAQENKSALALEQIQKAIDHTPPAERPRQVEYILRKATLLRRDNRPSEALLTLSSLSARERAMPAALNEEALIWAVQGRFDRAAEVYEKAQADNPLEWKLAAEAARWRIKTGDRAAAQRDIEIMRSINPRLDVIADLEKQLP